MSFYDHGISLIIIYPPMTRNSAISPKQKWNYSAILFPEDKGHDLGFVSYSEIMSVAIRPPKKQNLSSYG